MVVGRLADPDQMIGLAFEQLYLERMAVVVPPGHPLLAERPLELRRIAAFEVLMPSREDITRPIADRLLIANGIGGLERRIETVSSDFSRAYLKQTDAVWIISYGVAALDIAAGDLVELPIDVSATLGAGRHDHASRRSADADSHPVHEGDAGRSRAGAQWCRGCGGVTGQCDQGDHR